MEEEKIFNETIKEIETQFGKNSITNFNHEIDKNIEIIKTGSLNLDKALGIGGYPKGRIIEIYGSESSGKTTIALQAIAQCQKNGGHCAYIDAEHALNAKYCQANGVNLSKLLFAQPESGEQSFAIIEALAKTGMIDLIVVDSVAALVPEAEINGEYEDQTIGLHARLMSKGLRIIQGIISKYKTTIIFINQIREKIGVFFGETKTTTGGWALKFFSSIRIELKRAEVIKNGTTIIGIKTFARIVKNKLAPPLTTTYLNIYFDQGFDYVSEIIDLALEKNIITKKGSWFYFNEIKMAQGKEGLKLFLKDKNNLAIFNKIEKISLKEKEKSKIK